MGGVDRESSGEVQRDEGESLGVAYSILARAGWPKREIDSLTLNQLWYFAQQITGVERNTMVHQAELIRLGTYSLLQKGGTMQYQKYVREMTDGG